MNRTVDLILHPARFFKNRLALGLLRSFVDMFTSTLSLLGITFDTRYATERRLSWPLFLKHHSASHE